MRASEQLRASFAPVIGLRVGEVRLIPGYAHGLHAPGASAALDFIGSADWNDVARRISTVLSKYLPLDASGESEGDDVAPMLACFSRVIRAMQKAAGLPDMGEGCAVEVTSRAAMTAPGRFRAVKAPRSDRAHWLFAAPSIAPRAAAEAIVWTTRFASAFIRESGEDTLSTEQQDELRLLLGRMSKFAPRGTNNRCFLSAANELGIPSLPLAGGVFQYGWGRRSRWLDSSFTEGTSRISTMLARNKATTAALLRQAGVPVPDHQVVRSIDDALEAARTFGFPVVVKPLSQDGGVGVSAGIVTETELRVAFERAQSHSSDILIEKHVEGRDYRVYVFRGKAVWAMERTPAGVTGDGSQSVSALVADVNLDPRRREEEWSPMSPILLDSEALELLESSGMSTESVPEAGRFIRLRRAANVSSGGTPVGVFDRMHPDNAQLCERAARLLRLDLAGIDLLMSDISRSWRDSGAAICEVNAQPQLSGATAPHMYAQVLRQLVQGKGRVPVAVVLTTGPSAPHVTGAMDLLSNRRLCVGATSDAGLWVGPQRIRAGRESAFSDVRALMVDSAVEAMVIGTDGQQFLETGLPLDRIDVLAIADWAPPLRGRTSQALAAAFHAVLSLFKPYCTGDVMIARQHWGTSVVASTLGRQRLRLLESPDDLQAALARALPLR